MKYSKKDKVILNDKLQQLATELKKLCHAKGCINEMTCPEVCGCAKDRNFKLNIYTAFFWEVCNPLLEDGNYETRYKSVYLAARIVLHHTKNDNIRKLIDDIVVLFRNLYLCDKLKEPISPVFSNISLVYNRIENKTYKELL